MKKLIIFLALLVMIPFSVNAEEISRTEIWTVEDLIAISEDPNGDYILMTDLDMTGIAWKGLDFSGTFNGNGYSILNLTLSEPGDKTPDSYDGNLRKYETTYYGLFSTMSRAKVENLNLINVRAVIEEDRPCFVGGIAGFMEKSTITGCQVIGTLELRAHDRIFGLGGITGYGAGEIRDCAVDATLITVDTDSKKKDEQFLGGIYATGFIAVYDCDVKIDGYISEYGYVHSGGVVGMYMEYPYGYNKPGYISGTSVTGKITFFEKNSSRRAYCDAFCGEDLVDGPYLTDNTKDFRKDERKNYDVELRPEVCKAPVYSQTVVSGDCETYGYTEYCCDGCGYTYRDHYTGFTHSVTQWLTTVAPTTETEGVSVGLCDGCGMEFEKIEPILPAELPTEPPTEPAEIPDEEEGAVESILQEVGSGVPSNIRMLNVLVSFLLVFMGCFLILRRFLRNWD